MSHEKGFTSASETDTAMSLLPLRDESSAEPDEPRVVGLDGEGADETFEALSSTTTREVLASLYEEPSTPAELRDEIGTTLQNVHYHLDKLEDADLIESAGVGYSEKGTEMTVYAPTSEAVVLFAGRRADRSRLRELLAGLFAVILALGVASAALRQFLRGDLGAIPRSGDSSGGGEGGTGGSDTSGDADAGAAGADATPTPESATDEGEGVSVEEADAPTETADAAAEATRTATETAARTATETADGGAEAVAALDPAVAFFLGGVFALLVGAAVLYVVR